MSALSQLLDRLRRVRVPPGSAAGAVAVPSPGEQLLDEVAFLLPQLDEIERQGSAILAAVRAEASQIEAGAAEERRRILDAARTDADQVAARLLAERRSSCEDRARTMQTKAQQESERVLARGRERTPALVDEVVRRLLESGA